MGQQTEVNEGYESAAVRGAPPYSVEAEQARFNRFIWEENERLNRLIRNLYLYLLQFRHYTERDLYDSICQDVATYFRAAYCELYVVRYGEKEASEEAGSAAMFSGGGRKPRQRLMKWLELAGAFGPARRALRQQYVRWRSRSRYEIPIRGPLEPDSVESMTRRAFARDRPTRYASCYDLRADHHRKATKPPQLLETEVSRQVVWYQDGLYNSCRCSLMAPLVREGGEGGDSSTPPYRKIGLIKVENRLPHRLPGFSDVPSEAALDDRLFFPKEWQIAALRPYIRDLTDSVKKGGDPFLPLHNNIGWQQYFDDHPLGKPLFHILLRELSRRSKQVESKDLQKAQELLREQLEKSYKKLEEWLENLVECLIRLESWFQHLQHACCLIYGVGETPSLDRPIPSLFNIYNLVAACRAERQNSSSNGAEATSNAPCDADRQAPYIYDLVCSRLVKCLTNGNEDATGELEKLAVEGKAPEIRTLIYSLCEQRAAEMCEKLAIQNHPFDIVQCLDGKLPDWQFQAALEQVLADLASVCDALEVRKVQEREKEYKLIAEEAEARQIARIVKGIRGDKGLERGEACTSVSGHAEPAHTGCLAARALAAATMYADVFHEIDEKRLVFVASHVAQVLDNYSLYQARQRELELDFDALDVLGLDHFGLELLDILGSSAGQTAHALRYLLERQSYCDRSLTIQSEQASLKELVKAIRNRLGSSPAPDLGVSQEDHWLPHCVAWVTCPGMDRLGLPVLQRVQRQALTFGLDVQLTSDGPKLTFQPSKSLEPCDGEPMVEGVLRLARDGEKQTGAVDRLELLIRLDTAAVQARDLRALWSAVKVLEDVLKAVKGAARGG